MKSKETDVPILIVGGGLVGLSMALFLSQQNIRYKLIERHENTSIHPKASGFNLRTMELYRELGIKDLIQNQGKDLAKSQGWYTAHTLSEANFFEENINNSKDPKAQMSKILTDTISPEKFTSCSQNQAEPILLEEANFRGGDLNFYTELINLEQQKNYVFATIRNRSNGIEEKIKAQYVVAADGVRSPIRKLLEIPTNTKNIYGHIINIYFKADLSMYIRGHEFFGCNITHEEASGTLFPVNNKDLWCFHVSYNPELGETVDDFDWDYCYQLLRKAIGLYNIDINIISILPWIPKERITKYFQNKRVFLAGDAAHEMPPTGGFGANTGIQDAHNLAWKLAMVIKNQAGNDLLTSYGEERKPVAEFTIQQARRIAESGKVSAIKRENHQYPSMNDHLIATVGYYYLSNAIVTQQNNHNINKNFELSGKTGTRLPHIWAVYENENISFIDLPKGNFTLILAEYDTRWVDAIKKIKKQFQININMYSVGENGNLSVDKKEWERIYQSNSSTVLLVRPDHFVCWRTDTNVKFPQHVLENVLTKILMIK